MMIITKWNLAGSSSVGGSEHSVNHQSWPGEIQIYGYNSQLYSNLTQAQEMPGGVVAVSVMLQVKGETPDADVSSSGLHRIVSKLSQVDIKWWLSRLHDRSMVIYHVQVRYRGDYARIHQMSLSSIMPNTADYITYEGSTTYPGCWESVTWIVMNKPVYISKQEMEMFHMLRQGDSPMMEKAPLGNNLRPRQPVNSRAVRTNIALHKQKVWSYLKSSLKPLISIISNLIVKSVTFRILILALKICPRLYTLLMIGFIILTPIQMSEDIY